jgi:hypothetical protein
MMSASIRFRKECSKQKHDSKVHPNTEKIVWSIIRYQATDIMRASGKAWMNDCISAQSWNGIYQLKWKFRFFARPTLKEKMNLWSRKPANAPYKYTLLAPAEPVVLAHARLAASAIQLNWKSPAEMEFSFQPSSWNGIFISAQQLKWKFEKNIGRAARPLPISFKGFRCASIMENHNYCIRWAFFLLETLPNSTLDRC